MRIDNKLLLICLVACGSPAIAADPPAQSAPTGQTQAPAPTAQSTAAPSEAPKPAESSSTTAAQAAPVAAASSAASDKAAKDEQDKRFRKMGYTPEVKGGETFYCRKEAVLGSRFPKQVCGTASSIDRTTLDSKNMTEQIQRQPMNAQPGH
jgi:hypothetical protein